MTNSDREHIKSEIAKLTVEIKELQEKIDDLEKSEKKSSRWKPEWGEVYFFITNDGYVSYKSWNNDGTDNDRYAIGNIFPTKEAAKFERERLKVIAEMQEFAYEPDWENLNTIKYRIDYSYAYEQLRIDYYTSLNLSNICFKTGEQAQACIDSVGKERIKKYYFRIKED